jgi:predicted permease
VIGKTVRFNGEPYDIIGVMPKGFAFPDREAALWAPVTIGPDDFALQHFFSLDGSLIGWLKPGVNVNVARERVRQAIGTWLAAHLPYKTADGDLINKALLQKYGFAMQVQPYRQNLLGDRPATLWLLQGAVLLILLITCVNVANLLLSRVLGRSHEMAMRSALGASRVTLGRQLLGEALCLTVPAGLGGVALAWLALHFLAGSALGAGNSIFNMTLDWRVGLFALAAVLFTALLVSVLPIRQLAKTDLQLVLQEGSRTSGGGRGARRTRNVLVIAELTLATGLLAMSGLLLHSFMNIEAVHPGFRTDHVLIAHLTVSPNDFSGTEAWSNTFKDVVKQVDTLPGVRQATISDMLPLTGYDYHMSFAIPGQVKPGEKPPAGMVDRITGGFFKTLGISVLQGRDFNDSDTGQARAIIDAAVAARYFHDATPIGRRIRWRHIDWTIVGVVPPVKYSDLSQAAPPFTVYLNVDKSPSSDMYLLVHTALPPSALFKPLQHLLATAFPKVAVNDIHTMHDQMSDLLSHRQTTMALLLGFGGIALALAIVGVYAVMSYAVSQRRAECGVRLALGAQPEDLRWLVLRDGLRLLAVGLVLGLGLAVLLGYLMSAQLFGVAPFDPATLIGSTLVLCVITVAACYLPARRASKLDPAVAMMEQ